MEGEPLGRSHGLGSRDVEGRSWMAAGGGGAIINISSIAGVGSGWPVAYAAAKAALISHAKTLAINLAPQKIRVNTVAPGSIEFEGGNWARVKEGDRPFYDSIVRQISLLRSLRGRVASRVGPGEIGD